MNKKIMAIGLLVIVAAISISGCLGPNEDELYNEKNDWSQPGFCKNK